MTTLVIGASGTVGKSVLAGLAKRGVAVRGMSRYANNLEKFPAGAEGCVADLVAPGTVAAAFKDIDQLFLLTPLSQNEIQIGRTAISAAQVAGVKRIVYMSVPMPEGSDKIPHYRNKVLIEKALKESGIPYTILRPNNFFQNDMWGQSAIMAYATYPQPLGNVGLNRVDSRDAADAAVNALTQDGFENQEFAINGSDLLTGDSTAAEFSKQLGREVNYAGDDLEAWAKQSQLMMPAWMVANFKIMYEYFQTNGQVATQEDLDKQQAIVGHPPRSFADYVGEVTRRWSQD